MVRTSILLFFIDTIHLSGNANANSCLQSSVADLFIHPGSRISNPTTATKVEGKKICWTIFFCSYKYNKIEALLLYRNKFELIHKESQYFQPKKLSLSSEKYGFGIQDLEKNLFLIPTEDFLIFAQQKHGSGTGSRFNKNPGSGLN